MGRFYMHCPRCRKRMKMFKEDSNGERTFYICKNCGTRSTYLSNMNGLSEDWPREIFDEAVRCGVVTKEGKCLWT